MNDNYVVYSLFNLVGSSEVLIGGLMVFKVDKKTIEQSTKCQKCFSCLENNGKDLCKVNQCIEDKILFVECDDINYCSYQKSFGDNKYCQCPVRKEIFTKYKV